MNAIPLVRTYQYLDFLDIFSRMGLPTSELLEDVGLSESLLGNPNAFMAEYPLWSLIDNASILMNNNHIGLDIAEESDLLNIGEIGPYILNISSTLEDLLSNFCDYFQHYSTSSRFWLDVSDEGTWLCRQSIVEMNRAQLHMEQYYLMLMIELVRQAGDKEWTPDKIFCQYQNNDIDEVFKKLPSSQFYFGKNVTAILIPHNILGTALVDNQIQSDDYDNTPPKFTKEKPIKYFVQSLYEALGPFLENDCSGVDVVTLSQIIGIKPRTLQRRLAESGLSYSRLLADLRFDKAAKMLGDTKEISIIEIAYSLGYSQPSHFTRAFRRWTGVSPKKYKSVHKVDDSLLHAVGS